MKERNGFVSNSSSSSFVIALPKNIKTSEELKKIMWGDRKSIPRPYDEGSIDTQFISDDVFQQINHKEDLDIVDKYYDEDEPKYTEDRDIIAKLLCTQYTELPNVKDPWDVLFEFAIHEENLRSRGLFSEDRSTPRPRGFGCRKPI